MLENQYCYQEECGATCRRCYSLVYWGGYDGKLKPIEKQAKGGSTNV